MVKLNWDKIKDWLPSLTLLFMVLMFVATVRTLPARVTKLETEKIVSEKAQLLMDSQQSAVISVQAEQINRALSTISDMNNELKELNKYLRDHNDR